MRLAVLIAALALAPGCASTLGTLAVPQPYVGTRVDAGIIGSHAGPGLKLAACLDLPASAALDTALLPYTLLKPKRL